MMFLICLLLKNISSEEEFKWLIGDMRIFWEGEGILVGECLWEGGGWEAGGKGLMLVACVQILSQFILPYFSQFYTSIVALVMLNQKDD